MIEHTAQIKPIRLAVVSSLLNVRKYRTNLSLALLFLMPATVYSQATFDKSLIPAIWTIISGDRESAVVTDSDGDGVEDSLDAFPFDETESLDTDNDGMGDNADDDDDGDGVLDDLDAFPLDSAETIDTDQDGIGNNIDTDDDGDGLTDFDDPFPLEPGEVSIDPSIVASSNGKSINSRTVAPIRGNLITDDDGSGSDFSQDGLFISLLAVSAPSNGYGDIFFFDDGAYAYVLNVDAEEVVSLKESEQLVDVFNYWVIDENGRTSKSQLTITIEGMPPAYVPDGNGEVCRTPGAGVGGGRIIFREIEDVYEFQEKYGPCTIIDARSVEIVRAGGPSAGYPGVPNVDALINIREITGRLEITQRGTDFDYSGFTNLKSVGGIRIDNFHSDMRVFDNLESGGVSICGLNSDVLGFSDLRRGGVSIDFYDYQQQCGQDSGTPYFKIDAFSRLKEAGQIYIDLPQISEISPSSFAMLEEVESFVVKEGYTGQGNYSLQLPNLTNYGGVGASGKITKIGTNEREEISGASVGCDNLPLNAILNVKTVTNSLRICNDSPEKIEFPKLERVVGSNPRATLILEGQNISLPGLKEVSDLRPGADFSAPALQAIEHLNLTFYELPTVDLGSFVTSGVSIRSLSITNNDRLTSVTSSGSGGIATLYSITIENNTKLQDISGMSSFIGAVAPRPSGNGTPNIARISTNKELYNCLPLQNFFASEALNPLPDYYALPLVRPFHVNYETTCTTDQKPGPEITSRGFSSSGYLFQIGAPVDALMPRDGLVGRIFEKVTVVDAPVEVPDPGSVELTVNTQDFKYKLSSMIIGGKIENENSMQVKIELISAFGNVYELGGISNLEEFQPSESYIDEFSRFNSVTILEEDKTSTEWQIVVTDLYQLKPTTIDNLEVMVLYEGAHEQSELSGEMRIEGLSDIENATWELSFNYGVVGESSIKTAVNL